MIMDMQCDLLVSSFDNPKTTTLMEEKIGRISDGSSPHCAGALKLGFKKAFDTKKQDTGVLLRCSNNSCELSKTPVSYSSVLSSIYCTHCGWFSSSMLCTGCGHVRASNCASCQGCGNKFA